MEETPFILALVCLLIMILAVPMIRGKVKPNSLYGFRTEKTLSNATIWYKANRYSGWALLIAGSASLLCFIAMLLIPNAFVFGQRLGVHAFILLFPLGMAVGASVLYLNKL